MNLSAHSKASGEPARAAPDDAPPLRPRERILNAARELFYERGLRAVGVEEIADAAGTNKMTLYRHFASKDELVAACLRQFAEQSNAEWDRLAAAHPGDALGELTAWLANMAAHLVSTGDRGCALANAAMEIREEGHPARPVIEAFKRDQRDRLVRVCAAAGLYEPEFLADELYLLIEGARVSVQSVGRDGPAARLVRMGTAIIVSHSP